MRAPPLFFYIIHFMIKKCQCVFIHIVTSFVIVKFQYSYCYINKLYIKYRINVIILVSRFVIYFVTSFVTRLSSLINTIIQFIFLSYVNDLSINMSLFPDIIF